MTYVYLKNLKKYNQTLKLLNSDNFAMLLSFFYYVFTIQKHISVNHTTILNYLDDFLYDINQGEENLYPRTAKEYLEQFTHDKNGYLKKYHGSEDEAMYELTPYSQKALEFIESLEKKEFVGSRTKFNIIFELLEELEFETNLSDEDRIKSLQKQKDDIDIKIQAIRSKKDLRFDNSRIKEHFMLIEEQSRKLKYDFSQIEYNFRDLNQAAMEKIATAYSSKDNVLSSIFDIEDEIRQSDQGKSFFAFWQILTNAQKNEQLSTMLEKIYEIDTIKEFDKDQRLKNLKYELLTNAQKITKVSSKLIEQLRRFLDDRVWIENKQILELCKSIEKTALNIKTQPPSKKEFMKLDTTKIDINSVFEKSLYTIKQNKEFKCELKEDILDINIDSFYDIFFIDETQLQNNINYFLQIQPQCTMIEILTKFPIKKGISELIGYLSIAKNSQNAIVSIDKKDKIIIQDDQNNKKIVTIPKIIFTKGSK
jgi:hypothetical protein